MPRSPGPTPRRPHRGAGLFRLESIPRLEEGRYLWRCPCYIELNMVRCRVVAHPQQWAWVGYHEIMGQRQRYRVRQVLLAHHLHQKSLPDGHIKRVHNAHQERDKNDYPRPPRVMNRPAQRQSRHQAPARPIESCQIPR